MQSAQRTKNFWIPPDGSFESAVPSPVSPREPATPTRATTTSNRPPLPLPNASRNAQRTPIQTSQAYFPPQPQPSQPSGRAGREYNRRERRFEAIFDAWSEEMTRLREEHRLVTLTCRTEEETKRAMDQFNAKFQRVTVKYNEDLEALQMSSSEPGSSQSENEDDDMEDDDDAPVERPSRATAFQLATEAKGHPGSGDDEDEDEDDGSTDSVEDNSNDGDADSHDIREHALDEKEDENDERSDDDEESVRNSERSSRSHTANASSADESDHSTRLSRRGGRSENGSEISRGSPGTPPPTEEDEDYRAMQRRLTRERRRTEELASTLASTLPSRLRSDTLRGSPPPLHAAPLRPSAMSLFENFNSSSPGTIPPQSPYGASRRPSRDAGPGRPPSGDVDSDAVASRIDYLRRQNSTSGSDRSLSRNRQPSPMDQTKIFRDQFETWKNAAKNRTDEVRRNAEMDIEESRLRFQNQQGELHKRAQQLFIANQEKMLQQISRNRTGSIGGNQHPIASSSPHARSGSFAVPGPVHVPSSSSPTLQRGATPVLSSTPTNRQLHSAMSQTFNLAANSSPSSPSHASSRAWAPPPTANPLSNPLDNRHSTASSSGSDEVAVDDEESDLPTPHGQKGTPPISIPNSARGSFDAGHRRMNSQIYMGAQPLRNGNNHPQHLRNSSSTTFSSSGTQSVRSSGGWSGVSGVSSNTTVTSSDTASSRRGSAGEKSFAPPVGLPGAKASLSQVLSTSPTSQGHRWQGSIDASTSTTHTPASTLSRATTLPMSSNASSTPNHGTPSRSVMAQWSSMASSSSPAAASSVHPGSSVGSSGPGLPSRPATISSLNLGQSPSKNSWVQSGQPSPPIPLLTRPSSTSSHRSRPDAINIDSSGSTVVLDTTPRSTPPTKTSMSSSDIFNASVGPDSLRARPSIPIFNHEARKVPDPVPRSTSPPKPALVAAKSSPSPATVTQASEMDSFSTHVEPVMMNRESKKAEKRRLAKEREEEERRKKKEQAARELAEEEDRNRIAQEEAERKRKEDAERKRKEEVERKRQEEVERKRKEEVERKRKEEAERKRKEEAEAAEKMRLEEEERQREEQRKREEEQQRLEELRKREEEERLEEARKREEEERIRQEELAREQAAEEERVRQEEIARKKAAEEERMRQEELARERAAEEERRKREKAERIERAKLAAAEKKRQQDAERERARQEAIAKKQREDAERAREAEQQRREEERLKALKQEEDEDLRREQELARREEEVQRRLAELKRREREQRELAFRQREERLRQQIEEAERLEANLREMPADVPHEHTYHNVSELSPITPIPEEPEPEPESSSNPPPPIPPRLVPDNKKKRKQRQPKDEQRELERQEGERQAAEQEARLIAIEKERLAEFHRQREVKIQTEQRERERVAAEMLAARRQQEEMERKEKEKQAASARKAQEEAERQAAAREAQEEAERQAAAAARMAQEESDRREAERLQRLEAEQARLDAEYAEREKIKQEAERRRRISEKRSQLMEEQRRRNAEERHQQEEAERRAQEARIREENARMTERFQARDRSAQVSSNMPKRVADAWEAYEAKWKQLVAQAASGGMPLTFATVPWPLISPPANPEAITRNAVGNFFLNQWNPSPKSRRDRIRDALLRWHPDRFESRYLGWVPEGEERDTVRSGVGNVVRSLNELLTKESTSGAL